MQTLDAWEGALHLRCDRCGHLLRVPVIITGLDQLSHRIDGEGYLRLVARSSARSIIHHLSRYACDARAFRSWTRMKRRRARSIGQRAGGTALSRGN